MDLLETVSKRLLPIFIFCILIVRAMEAQGLNNSLYGKWWDRDPGDLSKDRIAEQFDEFDMHCFWIFDISFVLNYYQIAECYLSPGDKGYYTCNPGDSILTLEYYKNLYDSASKDWPKVSFVRTYKYVVKRSEPISLTKEERALYPRQYPVLNKIRSVEYSLALTNPETKKTVNYKATEWIENRPYKRLERKIARVNHRYERRQKRHDK